jgi:hypothetical protein
MLFCEMFIALSCEKLLDLVRQRTCMGEVKDRALPQIVIVAIGWVYVLWNRRFYLADCPSPGDTWMNDIDKGKPKNSEKNLLQCHFVYHKSLRDWLERERGPTQREAGY